MHVCVLKGWEMYILTQFWEETSSCGRRCGAYSQDPGDLARSDPFRGQLNHCPPLGLGQRSTVEEHPSELVDTSTTLCWNTSCIQRGIYVTLQIVQMTPLCVICLSISALNLKFRHKRRLLKLTCSRQISVSSAHLHSLPGREKIILKAKNALVVVRKTVSSGGHVPMWLCSPLLDENEAFTLFQRNFIAHQTSE